MERRKREREREEEKEGRKEGRRTKDSGSQRQQNSFLAPPLFELQLSVNAVQAQSLGLPAFSHLTPPLEEGGSSF